MHSMIPHVLSLANLRTALPTLIPRAIMLLCNVELIVLLVIAALSETHRRRNLGMISLIVALLALPYGLAAGWSFPGGFVEHGVSAMLLGGAMFAGFRLGLVGDGDVRLMAALGLWLSPPAAVSALLFTAVIGGLMASAMQREHRSRLAPPRVPYTVGIAAAGIVQFAAPLAQLLS